MGPHPPDAAGGGTLSRIAQVVPNLATFGVDDGFSYRVPDTLDGVTVGSMVRVPLGGRRVRGFVTHLRAGEDRAGLRDVLGVVGDFPVFTPRLLETMRWSAIHYVAPLAALLAKGAPPSVARRRSIPAETPHRATSPLPAVTEAASDGRHVLSQYLIGGGPWAGPIAGLASGVLAAGRNVAVVVPTVGEARVLAAGLTETLGIAVWCATSTEPDKEVTAAWAASAGGGGQLVVGTREIAFWPHGALAMAVVVEEGRPAMKAPQTPTTHVRDVLRRRATIERFSLVYCGPVPTAETLAVGVALHEPASRVWPLVDVVSRTDEAPGGGMVMDTTVRAMRGVLRRGGDVFVFVPRRGDVAAFRCVRCGEVRRCGGCAAAASRGDVCARCGLRLERCAGCGGERFEALGAGVGRVAAELRRALGDVVGAVGEAKPVTIGTERDLPDVAEAAMAVVIDADALVLAPHYRAEEDAMRTLARIALRVVRGRGHRCLVQTADPTHRVYETLRHGRPTGLLKDILSEREAGGFPPVTQLVALEITGAPPDADGALRTSAGAATVHGPGPSGDALRWLVAAPDLRSFKVNLRSQVQRWRDAGAKVRIDADPVRL